MEREALTALHAALADAPGWRLFMGFDGRQGALLQHRVREAIDLGCRRMVTETGEAVEGDPQHSYRNILKAGFELLDVRENFVPAR